MKRRDFLKRMGEGLLASATISAPLVTARLSPAATLPIDELNNYFSNVDGQVLTRARGGTYSRLMQFYSKRFECVNPEVLIYCRSPHGVAKAVRWCTENRIEFAVRSGGHCFEGLSRNDHVIIDVRGLNEIKTVP
jgi:FAD binding domain